MGTSAQAPWKNLSEIVRHRCSMRIHCDPGPGGYGMIELVKCPLRNWFHSYPPLLVDEFPYPPPGDPLYGAYFLHNNNKCIL